MKYETFVQEACRVQLLEQMYARPDRRAGTVLVVAASVEIYVSS